MHSFYKKAVAFWFVLLVLAFINATVREITYKPLLTPYIGMWAHQISSVSAIILFFIAIYFFLKRQAQQYIKSDLVVVGMIWFFLTIIFESLMNVFVRHLSVTEVLQTYYFWNGETWIYVLLSLIISPLLADYFLDRNHSK